MIFSQYNNNESLQVVKPLSMNNEVMSCMSLVRNGNVIEPIIIKLNNSFNVYEEK